MIHSTPAWHIIIIIIIIQSKPVNVKWSLMGKNIISSFPPSCFPFIHRRFRLVVVHHHKQHKTVHGCQSEPWASDETQAEKKKENKTCHTIITDLIKHSHKKATILRYRWWWRRWWRYWYWVCRQPANFHLQPPTPWKIGFIVLIPMVPPWWACLCMQTNERSLL